MDVKYKLADLEKIRAEGRCGALYFYCVNEECDHIYDKDDRETLNCPKCGTPRKVCGKYNIKGRTRCSRHGGKSLTGIESATYRGKGLSKSLPTKLFEYYQLSLSQPQELEITDDIHVLEARKTQLKSQLAEEGADALWKEARKVYKKFNVARRRASTTGSVKAAEQMADALSELESVLAKGQQQGLVWNQLIEVIQAQTRLKESEMKRRKEMSTIVTEEQVATMIGKIISIIRDRVIDQDVRQAILNDIQGMMIG